MEVVTFCCQFDCEQLWLDQFSPSTPIPSATAGAPPAVRVAGSWRSPVPFSSSSSSGEGTISHPSVWQYQHKATQRPPALVCAGPTHDDAVRKQCLPFCIAVLSLSDRDFARLSRRGRWVAGNAVLESRSSVRWSASPSASGRVENQ